MSIVTGRVVDPKVFHRLGSGRAVAAVVLSGHGSYLRGWCVCHVHKVHTDKRDNKKYRQQSYKAAILLGRE